MATPSPAALVMDLKTIPLVKEDALPPIAFISENDGFFTNPIFSKDFRLRADVYTRLKEAQAFLPEGLHLMIYEAYRPMARQIAMWNSVREELMLKYPNVSGLAFEHLCETFIANPYDGIGSGHQAACALDLTLCDASGIPLEMGTPMHAFNHDTAFAAEGIDADAKRNRMMLRSAMHAAGFINYPPEWWHYSYGDHQWAWLVGEDEAVYGPLDLPPL